MCTIVSKLPPALYPAANHGSSQIAARSHFRATRPYAVSSGDALSSMLAEPHLLREHACIGGQWTEGHAERHVEVTDPATGALLGVVPDMGAEDCRDAIAAAEKALPAWRQMPAKQRSGLLRKWYDLVLANQKDLAYIMMSEQGKPLAEAMGEISYAASFIEWFAEEAKRTYGDVIPSTSSDRRMLVFKQPVGVCAAITPWNFPSAMITRKAAAALAAGCTMVVKPSEMTPFSALALMALAEEAGIPPGVLNVVTCGSANAAEVGSEMTSNPVVKKISFTGSTAVGKKLMAQGAGTLKKMSLELGGNAPFIVFEDADVDAAVAGAIAAKYRNAGQTCVCTNRFYVHSKVHDEFVMKLVSAVTDLKVGRGTEEGVAQGPLISEAAVRKVEEHVADAVAKGAEILAGGSRHKLGGTFFQPTIIAGATKHMKVTEEETFGPLAPIYRFENEEEVLHAASDTPFGLAAYFYSRDLARVWRVSEALEYGMVGVNTGVISSEVAPFGGMKESGHGREGSKYGIDEYMNVKYVAHAGL